MPGRRVEIPIGDGGRQVYTVGEAARLLGISEAHAYDLINEGAFPVRCLQLGWSKKISKPELDRWLAGETA